MEVRYNESEDRFPLELRSWLREHLSRHFGPGELKEEIDPDTRFERMLGTELNLRIMRLALGLIGPEGLVERVHGSTDESSKWLRRVLAARAFTIGGGTSEVQRNIIGARALGLPRG